MRIYFIKNNHCSTIFDSRKYSTQTNSLLTDTAMVGIGLSVTVYCGGKILETTGHIPMGTTDGIYDNAIKAIDQTFTTIIQYFSH